MSRRFSFLFRNKSHDVYQDNALPKAIAFVDYEHWFISLEKLYGMKPNIQAWFDDIKKKCNIVEVIFFANFTKFRDKEVETKRIRAFTNKIIDTYNPDMRYKKDYTDFIILDNIYQKAMTDHEAELFIIFSGDGHFSSAGAFIRNFCNKKVGIYGVKNCISSNLKTSADWVVEIPLEDEAKAEIYNMIFTSLKNTMDRGSRQPTFTKTVELVSEKNNIPVSKVREAVIKLINDGYIIQTSELTKQRESIRVIRPDWHKIKADGIWHSA